MNKPPGVVPPGGCHLLVDFFHAKRLDEIEPIRQVCVKSAEATGATVLGELFHHFGDACGVSGVVLLAESHLSIHTWPENGIATVDVFVCGNCDAGAALPVLRAFFGEYVVKEVHRGRPHAAVMDYKSAGVDIEAGNAFVQAISPLAAATDRPGTFGGLGGFGALFDPKAAGYDDPVLVAGTDGVGTKLKLAIDRDNHAGVGIDLVAMCVNDVIVHGAEPVFFLDYFATGKLDPRIAMTVVGGIAKGCRQADCALVGGETAEMPGFYPDGRYDLAGFAVGLAERHRLLPNHVQENDVLIGLASSGAHANGFSLIRQVCGTSWDQVVDGKTLGERFLTPTRIYVATIVDLHRRGLLHAAAHITGGGLIGNIPRVLPAGLTARIEYPWTMPPEFRWLQRTGKIDRMEMLRTFNCGIGMVIVIDRSDVPEVFRLLADRETLFLIGGVVPGTTPEIRLPSDFV